MSFPPERAGRTASLVGEARAPLEPFRPSGFRALFERLLRGDERYRQMRQLAELEPHLLDDVGLTRHQVRAELLRSRR